MKIPSPKFVVFYNGTAKQPERQILRLSDSFSKQTGEVNLELAVEEAKQQGIEQNLITLVRKGLLAVEVAASELKVSVEEFEKKLKNVEN